ncbi:hypothetical protein [Effusibacillus dendaii]|uniref:hypothetical protein n=1 Tax=Effusibacillus dendaii TaxID=2743772 RepID=UPI00190E0E9F|nr:hypothetical protein [Effusibacillus dendaii]
MNWKHWVFALAAAAVLAAETFLPIQSVSPSRYIQIRYGLEIAYFVLLLMLGVAVGQTVQERFLNRAGEQEYRKNIKIYQLFAVLFVIASGLYLFAGWLPAWVGRHIIFFAGYYYRLSRLKVHKKE